MSYVAKAISDEERLLTLARPHWIYLMTGFVWWMIFILIGLFLDKYFDEYLSRYSLDFFLNLKIIYFSGQVTPISVMFTLIGITAFWPFFMTYISSEIGLTNERIIYKTGLIFVQIDQVDLDDIRAEHIYHGWLGWFLGYGKIRIDCRFIEDLKLPAISKPYRLVKASHNARYRHPEIEYGHDEFSGRLKQIEHHQTQATPAKKIEKLKNQFKISFWKSARDKSA